MIVEAGLVLLPSIVQTIILPVALPAIADAGPAPKYKRPTPANAGVGRFVCYNPVSLDASWFGIQVRDVWVLEAPIHPAPFIFETLQRYTVSYSVLAV